MLQDSSSTVFRDEHLTRTTHARTDDIFLISRIQEYRAKGYTETSSIVKGLVKTGSIITAAGMIMAIAFSGLLFTTSGVLYQMAFVLVLAVLLGVSCRVVPCRVLSCRVASAGWFFAGISTVYD